MSTDMLNPNSMSDDHKQRTEKLKQALVTPLDTERTVVRLWRLDEAEIIADFFNQDDKARLQYFGWPTHKKNGDDYDANYIRDVIFDHFENTDEQTNRVSIHVFTKDESKIIGALEFWIDSEGRNRLGPYISPSYRNQGIAAEVYTTLRELCEQLSLPITVAEIEKDNAASMALFKKFNFVAVGEGLSTVNEVEYRTPVIKFERQPS